jgi:drug/metabolite transporter (DMT)-like permease
MTVVLVLFVASSLRFLSRVLQKRALAHVGGIKIFQRDPFGIMANLFKIVKNPILLCSYFLSIASTVIWFFLLAKYPLSFVIPVGGISYAFILVYGKIFFGEEINLGKICGVTMIIVGAWLLFQK